RAAAVHRAVHQLLERGNVFADPLAVRVLGEDPDALVREAAGNPWSGLMRLFIAARTRYAEDALAAAVASGTRQRVVLAAGLDTFAHRKPHAPDGPVVSGASYPATQTCKLPRLAAVGEPWLIYFVPGELATDLRGLGFTEIEDLGPADLGARLLGLPPGPARPGGHVIRAGQAA